MRNFKLQPLALALVAAFASTTAHAQSAPATSEVGKITVTGEGDTLGTGLIIQEESSKTKSTVTKAQLDKERATSNPYQALALSPGVNTANFDATGLFGGNIRVRGFNSDQMGFTINGAPVNDSGSFSVFPQEYTDNENICEIAITQGSTDVEAPHIGASGGNVSISTCGPEDVMRVRVEQTIGQLDMAKTYVRFDTGLIDGFKAFISYSHSHADKFRGEGEARRDHVDAAFDYKVDKFDFGGSVLWNRAFTNNFRSLTLAQYAAGGRFLDFNSNIPQHYTPVNGTVQNEAGLTPASTAAVAAGAAYYGYSVNPFKNYLATGKIAYELADNQSISFEPYFWYGYGTGGTEQTSIAEGLGANKFAGGIGDLNGDGDTKDTVLVYRGSVTETFRPGATLKYALNLDSNRILFALWAERARHDQTQPATYVTNNADIGDPWLVVDDHQDRFVRNADGTLYQGRNQFTKTNAESASAQDAIDLFDTKLTVTPGISWRHVTRDYTNYANDGAFQGATYSIKPVYVTWEPNIGLKYQFTPEWQVYTDAAYGSKIPGNFTFQSGLVSNPVFVNGEPTNPNLNINDDVKKETSVNVEAGVRYQGSMFTGSAALYHVNFVNRIASAYDPGEGRSTDFNVGGSQIKGFEAEIGTVPYYGVSGYLSASYTKSTIKDDLATGLTTVADTSGSQFPDTPKHLYGASLQWADGPYLANIQTKYTGSRYLTLTNDTKIGGYTTTDVNLAYQIPDFSVIKKPIVRLNFSNIFDNKYLLANAGSGSSFSIAAANNPVVYVGAPRFISISLQADY